MSSSDTRTDLERQRDAFQYTCFTSGFWKAFPELRTNDERFVAAITGTSDDKFNWKSPKIKRAFRKWIKENYRGTK